MHKVDGHKRFEIAGRLGIVVALMFAAPSSGQDGQLHDPTGFVLWDAATVEEAADRLEASLGEKALVWETIGNYDGHSVYLVLRGKTSRAEIHETESDVQVSVRGQATSVIGGTLVDPEALPRKQIRGSSIRDGSQRMLAPGDIMHISPGVPHQLLIAPQTTYMYILIKIDEEPL